jgi:hypothetical protein
VIFGCGDGGPCSFMLRGGGHGNTSSLYFARGRLRSAMSLHFGPYKNIGFTAGAPW